MVITVEPGLYFPTDDEAIPKWCRGIGVRDVAIDRSKERVSKAGLFGGAADRGVLLIVQEASNGAVSIDLKDQSGGVGKSLRHVNTHKSLGSDREEDV